MYIRTRAAGMRQEGPQPDQFTYLKLVGHLTRIGWLDNAVAEAPWSVAEWAVALGFDNPQATVPVLLLG